MKHDPLCQNVRSIMAEEQDPRLGCPWCDKIAVVRKDESVDLQRKLDRAFHEGYERGRMDEAKWSKQ